MMYFFIPVALLFIAAVLLQQKDSSLGSMGGSDTSGDAIVQSRRGADKFLHRLSIVLAAAFLIGGVYAMTIA